jgi:hypothetical protein
MVALADLTKDAVLKTVEEFDELGRDAFLVKYGFGKSRGYFLEHAGKRYDSKAIAGVTHGQIGTGFNTLASGDFKGGDKSVAKRLRDLDFVVREPSDAQPVGIPFEVGRLYHRQRDIHEVFGGTGAGRDCDARRLPLRVPFHRRGAIWLCRRLATRRHIRLYR